VPGFLNNIWTGRDNWIKFGEYLNKKRAIFWYKSQQFSIHGSEAQVKNLKWHKGSNSSFERSRKNPSNDNLCNLLFQGCESKGGSKILKNLKKHKDSNKKSWKELLNKTSYDLLTFVVLDYSEFYYLSHLGCLIYREFPYFSRLGYLIIVSFIVSLLFGVLDYRKFPCPSHFECLIMMSLLAFDV